MNLIILYHLKSLRPKRERRMIEKTRRKSGPLMFTKNGNRIIDIILYIIIYIYIDNPWHCED